MYSPDLLLGASFDIIICHMVVQRNFPNLIMSFGGSDLPFLLLDFLSAGGEKVCCDIFYFISIPDRDSYSLLSTSFI
jgi:hypothetical protein